MDRAEFLKWAAEVMGSGYRFAKTKRWGKMHNSTDWVEVKGPSILHKDFYFRPDTSRDDFHRLLVAVKEKEPVIYAKLRNMMWVQAGHTVDACFFLPLSPFSADYVEGETLCGLLWEAKERKER